MVLNTVTNNIYGGYGAGPVATEVTKTKPEPKHNKYLRREPKVPFEQKTTTKVVTDEKSIVEEAETVETPEETNVEDPIEEKDETAEDTQEDEKVEE